MKSILILVLACLAFGPTAEAGVKKKGRVLIIYDRDDAGASKPNGKCDTRIANGKSFTAAAERAKRDIGATLLDTGRISTTAEFGKLVDEVQKLCDSGLQPFDDIRFYDHGCEGEQTVGEFWFNKRVVEAKKDIMAKLGQCVKDGGLMSLYGCSVGGGKPEEGPAFVQALADAMPHAERVQANAACSTWSSDGSVGADLKVQAKGTKKVGLAPFARDAFASFQTERETH